MLLGLDSFEVVMNQWGTFYLIFWKCAANRVKPNTFRLYKVNTALSLNCWIKARRHARLNVGKRKRRGARGLRRWFKARKVVARLIFVRGNETREALLWAEKELTTRIHHGAREQEVAVWSIPAAAAAASVIRAGRVSAVCWRVASTRPPDRLELRRTFSPRQVKPTARGFECKSKHAQAGNGPMMNCGLKYKKTQSFFTWCQFDFYLFYYCHYYLSQ